jgi:hypothetical protein
MDALLEAGRALTTSRPLTNAQLRDALAERWPDRDPAALAYAVRGLLPMVHVPPRGIWQRSGPIALTTVEAWLAPGGRSPMSTRSCSATWRPTGLRASPMPRRGLD